MLRVYFIKTALFLIASFITGCFPLLKPIKGTMQQGIVGQVFEKKGNSMPLMGKPFSKGKGYPTRVYVFEPTAIQQTKVLENGLYQKPSSALIGTYETDSLGHFKINLAPGRYSILVGYQDGYFVPYWNQLNELGIVQVVAGKFHPLEVVINIHASY